MILLTIAAFMIIAILELVPLYKERGKEKRTYLVYLTLFLFSFGLAVLLSLGIRIPSPAKAIEVFIDAIVK